MTGRVADRLAEARRRSFVGRTHERKLLRDALASAELPFVLLHIWGPTGIGKTSLITELYSDCEHAHVPAMMLDARSAGTSTQGFVAALHAHSPQQNKRDPWSAFLALPGKHVVFIDNYEAAAALDAWLRTDFLPGLSDTLVVLASREPPSLAWRTDLSWQGLMRVLALPPLSAAESSAYLAERHVPVDQRVAIEEFACGYPLALSLIADTLAEHPGQRFQPDAAPGIVATLLNELVPSVPSPAHRSALEACALAHSATEDLLASMLDIPDAHDLFEWLRGLPLIESGTNGLAPSGLLRELLASDLRWRNPDAFAGLHRRARGYYYSHLRSSHNSTQQRVMFDYVYLHRYQAQVRPYLSWRESDGLVADHMNDSDRDALLDLVALHEGPRAADIASRWLSHHPYSIVVIRQPAGGISGFLDTLPLHLTTTDERKGDPAAEAASSYLQRYAALRAGEQATMSRFWMAADTYQSISPAQTMILVASLAQWLTTPGLAFTFLPCADPDFWTPFFTYIGLRRLPEADFEQDGRRFAVFGHDWRAVPPLVWLEELADHETEPLETLASLDPEPEPLLVLNKDDFAAAVRWALRSCTMAHGFAGNPLLRSRLVMERVGARAPEPERTAALRAILQETVASLQVSPRERKLYRALDVSYLHPAPTQERAAEQIDVPFSTYRRHLQVGIVRVADRLWQREIGRGN